MVQTTFLQVVNIIGRSKKRKGSGIKQRKVDTHHGGVKIRGRAGIWEVSLRRRLCLGRDVLPKEGKGGGLWDKGVTNEIKGKARKAREPEKIRAGRDFWQKTSVDQGDRNLPN